MKKVFVFVFLTVFFAISGTASAHFLWMDPIGSQNGYNPGDALSVDVFLHAEIDDGLHAWSLSLGFDDTAIDGGELTFNNIVYGTSELNLTPADPDAWYEAGGSVKQSGESVIRDIARWDLLGFMTPETLTDGQDFLLFTANFTYNGGLLDGEDVWLEDIGPDGWDFDSGQFHFLEVYTDNTGTQLLDDNGPDVGAPVPVPAAIWLMGSGLVGLIGIRKRRTR